MTAVKTYTKKSREEITWPEEWNTDPKRIANLEHIELLCNVLAKFGHIKVLSMPGINWIWERKLEQLFPGSSEFIGVENVKRLHMEMAKVAHYNGYRICNEKMSMLTWLRRHRKEKMHDIYWDGWGPISLELLALISYVARNKVILQGGTFQATVLTKQEKSFVADKMRASLEEKRDWSMPQIKYPQDATEHIVESGKVESIVLTMVDQFEKNGMTVRPVAITIYYSQKSDKGGYRSALVHVTYERIA